MEPLAPTIYSIPAYRLPELEKRVASFARRADKLGLDAITYTDHGPRPVEIRDNRGRQYDPPRFITVHDLELHGTAPVLAGYRFVARIEHTPAGNLLMAAPWCDIDLSPYRDADADCDHCRLRRRRKNTFIVTDEAGTVLQVGSGCLKDFTGVEDPAAALKVFSLLRFLRALIAIDHDHVGGSGLYGWEIIDVVRTALRVIDVSAWISRGKARLNDEWATADRVVWRLSGPTLSDRALWDSYQAKPIHRQMAETVLDLIDSLDPGTSDYLWNLRVACAQPICGHKHVGLVASAAQWFYRYCDDQAERSADAAAEDERLNVFFGIEGERYIRELTIVKEYAYEGDYGSATIYTMEDDEGRTFKWFSSAGCWYDLEGREVAAQVGETFWFTFHVKGHNGYKDRNETSINRATATLAKPTTHKWLGTDGRIYRRKKDYLAATSA